MAAYPPALDHAAEALARLAQFLRDKPNAEAVIRALATEAQALETAFQDLLGARTLATAEGASLDLIGKIIGQPRDGMSDDDYRTYIQVRVKLNNGSGTSDELLELLSLIKPPDTVLVLRDESPAGFTIEVYGPTTGTVSPTEAATLLKYLRLARAAGVRGILEWAESPDADVFRLDGTADQALDNGLFRATGV